MSEIMTSSEKSERKVRNTCSKENKCSVALFETLRLPCLLSC